jgi:preprotein translocase subunit SecE
MANKSRAQRRARREERGTVGAGEAALPGGPPAPPRRPTARAEEQPQQPDRGRRFPGAQFLSESWGELKKVDWPTQKQIIQATVVVIVACAIVGTYLWLADLVFKPLVEKVFL